MVTSVVSFPADSYKFCEHHGVHVCAVQLGGGGGGYSVLGVITSTMGDILSTVGDILRTLEDAQYNEGFLYLQ